MQSMGGNIHLDRPVLIRAQPIADHLLEPADGGFDAGSGCVARFVGICQVSRQSMSAAQFMQKSAAAYYKNITVEAPLFVGILRQSGHWRET
jgi:hypothetical protein